MEKVLSCITASSSPLTSSETKLKITETDPELPELLSLKEDEEYSLQPDFSLFFPEQTCRFYTPPEK